MKRTFALLLLGLFFCGCVNQQTAPTHAAMDLVRPGTDTTWNGGQYVLHVADRTGSALTGILVRVKPSNGEETVITTDTGTIAPGAPGNRADQNSVRITLHHATTRTPTKWSVVERLSIVLQK